MSGLASGMIAIAAGHEHNCALTEAGGVMCWGHNRSGELGDGTKTDRLTPVSVSGLTMGVMAIAAGGSHTCALTEAGGVKCWGYNGNGQIGDGSVDNRRKTPVSVSGVTSGVAAIATGYLHSCALTAAGVAKCWGWNATGQLGDGTTKTRLTPIDVVGFQKRSPEAAADPAAGRLTVSRGR